MLKAYEKYREGETLPEVKAVNECVQLLLFHCEQEGIDALDAQRDTVACQKKSLVHCSIQSAHVCKERRVNHALCMHSG